MASYALGVRRGLPRVKGGQPWPPGDGAAETTLTAPVSQSEVSSPADPGKSAGAAAAAPATAGAGTGGGNQGLAVEASDLTPTIAGGSDAGQILAPDGSPLRRGLPRVSGGEPWPALGAVAAAPVAQAAAAPRVASAAQPVDTPAEQAVPKVRPVAAHAASVPSAAASTVAEGTARSSGARIFGRSIRFWALSFFGVIAAAGIIVLAARGVTTLPGVPEFLKRYPGEYQPTVEPEPGFPAWARWTHFLNFFFMVLIVRSGLLVRQQQKPSAFYTPKRGGKKVSIYLWLHTSLDVLWLVNGVVFVVLMFVSGHWARVVPTSWEVFPNALSAMLQYLTLEWPHENGWVNYNSLQQLMYFTVVFIAAPLATITGVRMSEWWPKDAERLNRAYPAPLARAIHFPVMLFFCLFAVVHVFLVLATGALRNLNHMFGGSDEVSWLGFGWFAVGLAVTVAAVIAARPLALAPIAGISGKVSER